MIALLSSNWEEIAKLKEDINSKVDEKNPESNCLLGELYDQQIVLAITGVGIKRARTISSNIIQKYKPELMIFAGFAGALSLDLKLGDIIMGTSITSIIKNETKTLYTDFSLPTSRYTMGPLLTESRFIYNPQEKNRLFDSTGALAVDMETWGVVEAAMQSKIPVCCVRVISDEANEILPDMAAIYSSTGELDEKKAEQYFNSNPELLAPYLKFRFTNTYIASKSLCEFIPHILRSSR
ncbi:MAG: hypothetical protein AAF462_04490 [Thermodesulfobacteriota bacterium]